MDCEVRDDSLTRQLYATDASIYQITPRAVAFPRTAQEAAEVIRRAADAGWGIIPRGAGTGLVGGAIGSGLIVEFARYNQAIRELNVEARTVRVGAGVVLDNLNAFLRPHGLCFGPDVATSSRATLGGMIGNDSSGARTPVYGTTAEHLVSLEVITADGRIENVGLECEGLSSHRAAADALVERHAAAIIERLPPGLLKRRPGYGFDRYLRRRGDLTCLVAGSEGTLAGVFSAEIRLVPLPRRRGLGLLFFASVADAMQATVEILDLRPAAIEHIDRLLFDQTRGQLAFAAARALLRLDDQPAEAILIVEFMDEEVGDRLHALAARSLGMRRLICTSEREQALVWALRKAGLTLLTGRPGPAKPVTGIEDVAVRPEQLPAYVAGLRSILDPLAVEACFYGHAAAGLLHVRPVLDLHTAEGVRKLRHIADEVSALVRQFGGSIAGEHGVGIARTEYLPEHLGPELTSASRELKRLFDPREVMNPGKLLASVQGTAEPFRMDTNLRQGAGHGIRLPFLPVLGFVEKDHSFVGNLEQCDGSGVCLKHVPSMCPTYIATGEEIMSTRGRANTIRAVLEGRLGTGDGRVVDDGSPGPVQGRSGDDPLLSTELDAALGPCLSCKACKTECPSNVDLALLKAELLHARHRRAGVPLLDRVIASADRLGRIGCATAPITNRVMRWPVVRALMERLLGIAAERPLPAYAQQRFDRWFEKRPRAEGGRRGRVVLWDDTWVRYHESHIGRAAVRVLEAAGFEVVLPRGRECCGRPAFSRGLLDEAARLGRHNLALLTQHYPDVPVLFLEPSCHAMFIDEYRQLGLPGAEELARRCFGLEGFLCALLDREPWALRWMDEEVLGDREALASGENPPQPPLGRGGSAARSIPPEGGRMPPGSCPLTVAIHAHCHARALTDVSVLPRLAGRVPGVRVELLDTGCCGMAGAYGMVRDKYELSLAVARPLIEKIRALPPGSQVVACGTSCRHQIEDLAGVRPLHMAELLAAALTQLVDPGRQ
ncbi:MAG: dimethylmenaquinone methyltransferase [Phycisphaerae bacterium]